MAGLTPENVTQALTGAINVESLKSDIPYKAALAEDALARAKKNRQTEPLDQLFSVKVPGVGAVTQRQWNSLPTSDKEYALYHASAINAGEDPGDVIDKQAFEALSPTEREKFMRAAMTDPKLMAAATELARAGATTIGDVTGRKAALNELETKNYVTDPKGLGRDIDKIINDEEFSRDLFPFVAEGKAAFGEARTKKVIRTIEGKLANSGAEVVDIDWTGDIVTWKLRFKDGTEKEFRYGVGPRPTK